jgi:hypothetical protein
MGRSAVSPASWLMQHYCMLSTFATILSLEVNGGGRAHGQNLNLSLGMEVIECLQAVELCLREKSLPLLSNGPKAESQDAFMWLCW